MKLSAISPEQFSAKAWKRTVRYDFTAQLNSFPVTMAELAQLVPVLPLAFMQDNGGFQLQAVTSLQRESNLFLGADGRWLCDYVPAAFRTYPFRLAKAEGRKDLVLCIDEDSGTVVDAGQGEAFFDGAGLPSQALKDVLDLLSLVERSREITQIAVNALQAEGLIQPWAVNLQQENQTLPVHGLYRIDEAALSALPDEAFVRLRKAAALPVAYAQLLSMNQLSMLSKAAAAQANIKAQAEQRAVMAAVQPPTVARPAFQMSTSETIKF